MSPDVFIPRPAQEQILAYEGGPMGISAVPGSGKTFTLSLLAARLVERLAAQGDLVDREVLIVTCTNSAAENFRARIGHFLHTERGLLPGVGYRVRTLHGLAHDIVRERPGLVNLSENFDIIDERTATEIQRESVIGYLRRHPDLFAPYIQPDYLARAGSIGRYIQDDAIEVARNVIRVAKEMRLQPHVLQATLRRQSGTWPLLDLGLHVYADYQRSLFVRGAVDFDDLILLALEALEADQGFLARLQERWPYVLEDEAQDSSLLQELMLRRLTESHGNWVRVGDPNQAINTTFTSANTRFLRRFMEEFPAGARDLPNSGRSCRPIIDLANHLIEWSRAAHPILRDEDALTPPLIEPTPLGDPQPNPEPGEPAYYFHKTPLTPELEVEIVVRSLLRWLPEHPDMTVAVLVPENQRGFHVTAALEQTGLEFDDSLLRTDVATRAAANALATVLTYIAQPQLSRALERVWREVWWPRLGEAHLAHVQDPTSVEGTPLPAPVRRKQEVPQAIGQFAQELHGLTETERFLFPTADDWLDELAWLESAPLLRAVIEAFRRDLQRWTRATVLPIDELVLTVGNDLFSQPADLALAHHLALLLGKLSAENPAWRLPELASELEAIAQNRRRGLNFSEDGGGYTPVPGKVTVATMHAAKGLEWDRVYLMAVNNYSFPSGGPDDSYRSERFYARDNINLVAEAIAQVRQLAGGSLDDYVQGQATEAARHELAAERLRLLYVAITRARRELIVTYNTGRQHARTPNPPAVAFEALRRYAAGQSPVGIHSNGRA